MPRRLTMSDLVTRCQRRADMENDPSISTAEWYALVSEMYGELYTLVVDAGWEYFESTHTYTSDGTNILTETSDHFATVQLAYLVDATTGRYRALRQLGPQERILRSGISAAVHATSFAMVDDKIYLYPTPPSGQTYEMRYVPQPPDLTTYAGTDLVDVVVPDGEALMCWGVAVKALSKSESDVTVAMRERDEARQRFDDACRLRAQDSMRRRISDVETNEGFGWMWDHYG